VITIVAVMTVLTRCPFDHSWIPGIYDGDFGVVVALVTDAASSVDTTPLEERSPEPVVFELQADFRRGSAEQSPLPGPDWRTRP